MIILKKILCGALLALFFQEGYSQSWQLKQVPLQSHWAANVSPSHTLEAYPRPQMKRGEWTNLNGIWEYAITAQTNILPSKFDGKILVPYPLESALSGVQKKLKADQLLWYKKVIAKPALQTGEHLLLNFGAVDWQATVFINGKEAGHHQGGYQAFSIDITDLLTKESNEIIVKVFDPTELGYGPHGKQISNPANIYYTSSSGIWQTVWLETVPATHIVALKSTPDIDNSDLNISVGTTENSSAYSLRVTAYSGKNKVSTVTGKSDEQLSLPVPHAHLWSPDDPFLYDLTVELLKGKQVIDKVQSYFGMRKVRIQKDDKGYERIFLNNKYVFNLGVLDQGFWPAGLYTAPTDEAMEFDIKAIKAMGFNTIRKHIKIEPARWYYYADKQGMMVWQDFVNPNQVLPAGAKEEFEREAKETMDQLHNYPSITTWVLFNERWGAYDQGRLTNWVKQYDPSRIVNGHSGQLLYVNNKLRDTTDTPYINSDLTDVHAYPEPRNPIRLPGKAMVLGEFGGVGVPVPYHEWNDLQGWGYVQVKPAELVQKYGDMMQKLKELEKTGLSGSIYTQPFDVEGEENGLMTYDRKIAKIPFEQLRRMNAMVLQTKMNPDLTKGLKFENIDPNDTDERYTELLKEFDNGKRDSAFLRRLILISMRKQDSIRTQSLSKAYIDNRKALFTAENLKFISFITQRSTDPGLNIFMKDVAKVDSVLGAGTATKKIKGIILREEINPYLKQGSYPDWDDIQNRVTQKYGSSGKEYVIGQRMIYYLQISKEWGKFGEYYQQYFSTALEHSEYHINNITWEVFAHVTNKEVLKTAAKVMKYDIEHYDKADPNSFDTYANILYKLGEKEDAIQWETKALNLSGSQKVYIETLDKMKNNIPTW